MSVEFRQRSLGEFIEAFKRRKWMIVLPVMTMTLAIGYVVYKLPSIYESKTILTVKAPTISGKVVGTLSDTTISQRIDTINTEVKSRTSLEPMIAKYKLFELEKNAGVPTEIIIEKMRKNINVELEKTDRDQLASFKITYRDRSPESARNVAAELASKYVSAQRNDAAGVAEDTQIFIDKALEEKKKALDLLEKQRLDIMMQNVETLPESSQGLIAQLEGLRKREEGIGKEKETLYREKSRLGDRISSLNERIRLIEKYGVEDAKRNTTQSSDVTNSVPYGRLIEKRASLTAKLENLRISFREKHPDITKVKNEIKEVNQEIEKLKADAKRRATNIGEATATSAQRQKQALELEKQKAESQLGQYDVQIEGKNAQLKQNSAQINLLEAKINSIPGVKVALESIETQYQSAKTAYDDLQKKRNSAQLQLDRDSNAQGETIRVVDAANLPKSPVAPKRELLTAFGGGLGLAIGLFLAACFEVPRLFKIQNIEDAKHYTGLPLLASVPPLLTQNEISWRKRSHWIKVLAGITAAIGSIPVIIMILQATRVFDAVIS
ncbi:MAG: hypothetical protein HKN25_11295 [Pyrinomonadaceae bacterium]|nr:hypothetical protein [Pyrinomonadaceae bacterium]